MNFFKLLISYIFPQKLEERKSGVSGKVEVVLNSGKLVLDTAHVNYSFGGLHHVFQKAFSDFKIRNRNFKNVLVLGFGSGSVASILQDEYKMTGLNITGIEKDPEVITLAKKYFSIDKYKNLTLRCEDAFDFVQSCTGKFDLIVMDVFVDRDVPEKFRDERYIDALGKLLSDKGILFFNLVIHSEKVRDKGTKLFKDMNRLIGPTEWCRIHAAGTENWVYVSDRLK